PPRQLPCRARDPERAVSPARQGERGPRAAGHLHRPRARPCGLDRGAGALARALHPRAAMALSRERPRPGRARDGGAYQGGDRREGQDPRRHHRGRGRRGADYHLYAGDQPRPPDPGACRYHSAISHPARDWKTRGGQLFHTQSDQRLGAARHRLAAPLRLSRGSMDMTDRPAAAADGSSRVRARMGLSAKLLVLTLSFVMIAEVLIYVPSVANFRLNWLSDRLPAAHTAALVVE